MKFEKMRNEGIINCWIKDILRERKLHVRIYITNISIWRV